MKTLQITEQNARKYYKNASACFRASLEDTFGKEFFSEKITNRIKTYEDACREIGVEPVDVDEMLEMGFTMDEIVYRKLKTITEALNEGWIVNWKDTSQYKYIPWFNVKSASPSGFAFYYSFCSGSDAIAGCASRLCFKSRELSDYAGEQFLELYASFINSNQ